MKTITTTRKRKTGKLTDEQRRALGLPPCSRCGRYNTNGEDCTAPRACERRVTRLEQEYMENGVNPPFTIFVVRGEASEAQVPGLEVIGLWNDGGGHSTTRPSAVEQKQVRDALEGMREMFPPAVPGTLTDETFREWCQLRLEALRTKVDEALRALPRSDIDAPRVTARSLARLAAEYTDILDAFHVSEEVPGSLASAAKRAGNEVQR